MKVLLLLILFSLAIHGRQVQAEDSLLTRISSLFRPESSVELKRYGHYRPCVWKICSRPLRKAKVIDGNDGVKSKSKAYSEKNIRKYMNRLFRTKNV